jgi:hypothetical protein
MSVDFLDRNRFSMAKFNILSLDGGGTWAMLQAMALGDLYGLDTPGHDILARFRLVVANSGGSLTAAGLWANLTPRQLVAEFKSETIREQVFTKLPLLLRLPRLLGFGPKYYAGRKLDAIRQVLGRYDAAIADAPIQGLARNFGRDGNEATHLVVIAFDYDTNRAKFLRTNMGTGAGAQKDKPPYRTSLAEAVHASTNAPVNYFDAPARITYGDAPLRMWDGAIAGYNNPILAGITEALANGTDRDAICVLSLGTGSVVLPMRGGEFSTKYEWLLANPYARGFWPLIGDVQKLATSIVENPPDVATYIAFHMLGHKLPPREAELEAPVRSVMRIIRLNPLIQPTVNHYVESNPLMFDIPAADSPRAGEMPASDFRRLLTLDLDAVGKDDVDLIHRFGQLWLDDLVHNQPILAGPTKLECELGQRWFGQARQRAREIGLVSPPSPERQAITGGR